jgi:hypothetical protein
MQEFLYSPEVMVTPETMFLIRINGKETFLSESEDDSKLIIDSIAAKEIKKLQEDEWTKVFRVDSIDGKKITVSTQNLGRVIDGGIYEVLCLDYIAVVKVRLLKGRLERQDRCDDLFSSCASK